jgi:hypothetical protein
VARASCSSSEIATVPGTLVLVELLLSAGLMLVDWLVSSLKPRQRTEALGAAGVFSMFGFGSKKYVGHIFSSRKRSAAEEGRKAQEPRAQARRVEDLNGRCLARRGRVPLKPRMVLLHRRGLRGGGSTSGDGQTYGTGVGLGEPGSA